MFINLTFTYLLHDIKYHSVRSITYITTTVDWSFAVLGREKTLPKIRRLWACMPLCAHTGAVKYTNLPQLCMQLVHVGFNMSGLTRCVLNVNFINSPIKGGPFPYLAISFAALFHVDYLYIPASCSIYVYMAPVF